MNKLFKLSALKGFSNQRLILPKRFYCANNQSSTAEPRIVPVALSYNSYESTTSDSNASPVIIMHGLLGSKQNWRGISKVLHAKSVPVRKIFTVDARNHGESPHSPHHRYEDLAEDVREFYRQHGIERAIVIGHSMGGRTMMTFALKYPELVEKAVIVDVSPITTSPALKNMGEIFNAMRNVQIEAGVSLPVGRAMADKQIKSSIQDKTTRDFILLNLYRSVDGSFKWRSNVDVLHSYFDEHVARFPKTLSDGKKQFNSPVLFIGGKRSDYLTYKWYVNVDALDSHRSYLINFPDHLRTLSFDGPILFLGGTKSTMLNTNQTPAILKTFPGAALKFLEGGHNIGLVDNREKFIDDVVKFLNL